MSASHLKILENRSDKEPTESLDRSSREPERPMQLARSMTIQRYEDGKLFFKDDLIAEESDLRLLVNGQQEAVLSRTPGDDLNLVAGFLFANSMINCPEDIVELTFGYQGVSRVNVTLDTSRAVRRIYPSPRPIHLAPEMLFEFKARFEGRQKLYQHTGSTHAAALFSADGEMLSFGEDVGRHNGFDKAVGKALLEGTLARADIAMLSSRLALELAGKAVTANIPILCGFSNATSSAVTFAERNNLSLVGRIRDGSFNVYANGWRFR